MNLEFDYLTSISIGLFAASLILFICRFISYPITGTILAVLFSSLIAAFIYNPSKKRSANRKTLRATAASILFSIIFGVMFLIYYIEDPLKNEMYITTENESLKIMNNGIYTKISQDTTQIR